MRGYCFEGEVHRELREQARRFASAEIAPQAHEWEEAEEFPRDLYQRFARAGLLALGYSEEFGGSGGDIGHAFVASEELVLAGKSVGTCVGLGSHAIALPPIVKLGSQEQKLRFVAPVLAGECITRHLDGEDCVAHAAMAKNTATDMCCWVCDQAVQIHGGCGYMRETVVERLYRDARLYPIGGGTREIMNEIISKAERF